MTTIGVFPSGSEVSIEIARALKQSKDINLVGLGSVSDCGDVAYEKNISTLPFYTDSDFIDSLAAIVKQYDINFLVPGMDEVAYFLKLNEKEIGCEVIYASIETAEIIRRKSSTYNWLKDHVPTPVIYENTALNESISLPIFCKPDIGYGSRGAKKINTIDQLKQIKEVDLDANIYIEFLPGEELTVDCFSDNNSALLFAGPRKRERIRMGISVSTKPVELTDDVHFFASVISTKLSMTGCWFFQIKRSQTGEFKLMEVASRVSGSMAMYRLLGINFILLDIYQRLGKKVSIPKLSRGDFRIERAFDVKLVGELLFDSVYIDLDDCVILHGKVNTDLIAFIYGCRNRSIPIFLITRHAFDLEETLSKYAIKTLFDDVFHIKDGSPKSQFIKHNYPLFIDDSFSERQEVSDTLDCNVAAPDMVNMELLRK